ncbi:hypothetical protein B0T20DRAFT_254983 [Sordaria brevicollis]|uniref:Uncharacterized protein n=1 Tax=Sordaria brevicollis TaxID=83679 RepID=A0AAE0PD48_SORBR|nr:hypothetical protein B0T20DRAFT_254983 [Sordaria brevicollis]
MPVVLVCARIACVAIYMASTLHIRITGPARKRGRVDMSPVIGSSPARKKYWVCGIRGERMGVTYILCGYWIAVHAWRRNQSDESRRSYTYRMCQYRRANDTNKKWPVTYHTYSDTSMPEEQRASSKNLNQTHLLQNTISLPVQSRSRSSLDQQWKQMRTDNLGWLLALSP